MNKHLKDYLFAKHILVNDHGAEEDVKSLFAVELALARVFGVRITEGAEHLHRDMLPYVSASLGEYVSQAFYRGFPDTVLQMPPLALLLDQFISYQETYGRGNFSEARHSLLEEDFRRHAFEEDCEPTEYRAISEEEAVKLLLASAEELAVSTRSLSEVQYAVLRDCILEYGLCIRRCASKDTAVRLLLDTRDTVYARWLRLPDVLRFVDAMNTRVYMNRNPRKLNLRNADRKLIAAVLDRLLESGTEEEIVTCYEKKALWCGLLHHIHYEPRCEMGKRFVAAMRGKENHSVYADVEHAVHTGDVPRAAAILAEKKGSAALLRRLDYLISRCTTTEEIRAVLAELREVSPIVLMQMILHYARYGGRKRPRCFRFTRHGLLRTHKESEEEVRRRRSKLPKRRAESLSRLMRKRLKEILSGRLRRVYIDPAMYRMAVPLSESASSGGVGVLSRGTRIPFPEGKKLRAFTYWEGVNDIDLSVIGVTEKGVQTEFSWRSMYHLQSKAIVYSGDQTAGFDGGSEFFDLDLALFRKAHADIRYLVFCNNVYSNKMFSECTCRAGYMLRDRNDSGEVFEPKTVKSSFCINCESTYAFLFGLDLERSEFVWLNMALDSRAHVAGETKMTPVLDCFHTVDALNLGSVFEMLAEEIVSDPGEATEVLSDAHLDLPTGASQIRSCDFEKIMALLT